MGEKTASENVIGWGVGINASGEDAVIVHVQEKFSGFKIPDEFGELPTDTVEVGQVTAYQDPTERHRPTRAGVSVGHPDITSGTLGCLVEKDGNHYILSNNHILAATNTAGEGDPVVQPGPKYGGSSPRDNIAMLEDYKRIDFKAGPDNPNKIDAAIATVGDRHQTVVVPEIIGVGMPRSTPVPFGNRPARSICRKVWCQNTTHNWCCPSNRFLGKSEVQGWRSRINSSI